MDFAMCQNETCVERFNCRRFTATPNPFRQSYCDFKGTETEPCDSLYKTETPKPEEAVKNVKSKR